MKNRKEERNRILFILYLLIGILLLYCVYFTLSHLNEKQLAPEQSEQWWRMGYQSCESNFNYSSEEQMAVNLLRIKNYQQEQKIKQGVVVMNEDRNPIVIEKEMKGK